MYTIVWGEPLSINYIISMVFVFAVLIFFIFFLKNKSEKFIKIFLFPFSLLGIGAIIWNLTTCVNVYKNLPLNFFYSLILR